MSVLTAYLREAQAQQQAQPQQAAPHRRSGDTLSNDQSWPSAMSEKQQLAYRSLSEAAVDPRYGSRQSSEMVRATLQGHAGTPASSSFPGDIITSQSAPQNPHLSAASTTGMSLAQQSLLYAPSQQNSAQLFQQPQFSPQAFTRRNPFGSGRSSLETGYRASDPGRRPSFGQQDWMSSGSGPSRYSTSSNPPSSRYSQESDFFTSGRSIGVATGLHNSFDLDWAGTPLGKPDAPGVSFINSPVHTSCMYSCAVCSC